MNESKSPHSEALILASRFLLLPSLLGLIFVQIIYIIKFLMNVYSLASTFASMTEDVIMLRVLNLVDASILILLLSVVIIGSYTSFISNDIKDGLIPNWLLKLTMGELKIKLAGIIVGLSSISLVETFVDAAHLDWNVIGKRVSLHVIFIISAWALVKIEKASHSH